MKLGSVKTICNFFARVIHIFDGTCNQTARCPVIKAILAISLLFFLESVATRPVAAADLIKYVHTFSESYPVTSLAISPSGEWMASSSVYSRDLVVRRVHDGAEIARLDIPVAAGRFNTMAVSANGRWLATCTGDHGLMRIFNATTWVLERELGRVRQGGCAAVAFSPNNSKLAIVYERVTGSPTPTIVIFNTSDWSESAKVVLPSDFPISVKFVNEHLVLAGGMAYTADFLHELGSVVLWDSATRESPRSFRLFNQQHINSVAVAESGKLLAGSVTSGFVQTLAPLPPTDADIAGLITFDEKSLLAGMPLPVSLGKLGKVTAIVAGPSVPTSIAVVDGLNPRLIAFVTSDPSIKQIFQLSKRTYAASDVSSAKTFLISREKSIDLFQITN